PLLGRKRHPLCRHRWPHPGRRPSEASAVDLLDAGRQRHGRRGISDQRRQFAGEGILHFRRRQDSRLPRRPGTGDCAVLDGRSARAAALSCPLGRGTICESWDSFRERCAMANELMPVLPLENGDHLTREEFERRYDAMPDLKKAELIEGVVYMPSPVRHGRHSHPHTRLVTWLGTYETDTPGVEAGDNGSIRLDLDDEPQPDGYLIIRPDRGGQARISADDYIEGAPELI